MNSPKARKYNEDPRQPEPKIRPDNISTAFTVYPFEASIPAQIAPHLPCLDEFMAQMKTKILCIEDDRETAALIAEELVDRGYEVIVAHDGREGLAAILRTMPNLVLSDISMPAMSGFELLDNLVALSPRFSRMPFIFLTALTDRDNELKGRQLGADDYVTKPIDFEMLAAIIAARLAGVARMDVWPTTIALNEREVEVLTWAARGKTSAEIAKILGLTKRTVDFHIDNAREKLGAATRTEAVLKAATGRLIEP
jgi:DNA-binding response OmpR family regulator